MVAHLTWSILGRLVNGGDPPKLRTLVGHHGIVIFVGPNGAGKSLLAVEAVLPTLDGKPWECTDLAHQHNRPVKDHAATCLGCTFDRKRLVPCPDAEALLVEHGRGERLVYSTLPLVEPEFGDDHPRYRALTSLAQLPAIEHADVLFDEVAGISDADSSSSMPGALKRWLQQLRKRDVMLRVTTPAYKRCSLPIRQVATLVVDVRAYFPERSESGRLWRPRRAMAAKAYDAFKFGDFDKHSGVRQETLAAWYYWRPTGRGQSHYDTLAQVHALIEVEDSGACTVCSGSRSKPVCACAPETRDVPYELLTVVEDYDEKSRKRTRRAVPLAAVPDGPLDAAEGDDFGPPDDPPG